MAGEGATDGAAGGEGDAMLLDTRRARRYAPPVASGTSGDAACEMPAQPAACPRGGFGPSKRAAGILRRFLREPPRTWFWCYSSLATSVAHQKKSPGVLALSPGATLHFAVDPRMHSAGSGTGASTGGSATVAGNPTPAHNTSSVVKVRIEHLVSYEHMGIATVRCVGSCACDAHSIDAHRVDAHRNVSVFLQYAFDLRYGDAPSTERAAGGACALQMQILPQTSSGGHKFKVRTVTVSTD